MTTLTAFKFDSPDGADRMEKLLAELQRQQLVTIHDAAVVSWPEGKKKPKTRHTQLITTNFTTEQENKLRAAFAAEPS